MGLPAVDADSVALVTGASSGIGEQFARQLSCGEIGSGWSRGTSAGGAGGAW